MGLSARALLAATFLRHVSYALDTTAPAEEQIDSWKRRLASAAGELGGGRMTALQWQEEMDRILAGTPLEDLLRLVRFNDLRESILRQDVGSRGEYFRTIALPDVSGDDLRPADRTLITKIAHVKKGRHVPPHGHGNMVSAFLCISGEFDVQLYDKIEDHEDTMVIRQTLQRTNEGPGTWSSISDYRDNVHWLTAKSDNCFLFTCKLVRLEAGRPYQGRIHLDLRRPTEIGAHTLRANKITPEEAQEIY